MCGILGWVEPRGLSVDLLRLETARDSLRHRGPDEGRSMHDEMCWLGFRRLAVIDLTDAGAQPMRSADDALWIVFNGEIYNFVELRTELQAQGTHFRGHSDTEVLLALYQRHGRAMLERLNGMFAFALYDRRRRTLLLARDRLGEKPLFLWTTPTGLAFASEVRALRGLPGFPAEPSAAVLADYFQWGFVPGHQCVWPGVRKLPPATSVEFDLSRGQLSAPVRYWSPPAPEVSARTMTENEAVAHIGTLLDESVAMRLRADVPLGCFLSGGVDSSLVAEAAARLSGRSVASLTVKFPGWSDDEEPIARETAARLGLRARVVSLDSAGLDELPALCAHFDEPFADSSMLPTALVCRAAREQFTVVLSGDGGDEAFGGYDNHLRAATWGWVERVPRSLRGFAAYLARIAPADTRLERMGRRLARPTGRWGLGAKLYPFESTFARILPQSHPAGGAEVCAGYDAMLGPVEGSALDEAQRTDLRVYLPDDILVKSDRMSMLQSLEVRAPFLDHRVVEAGLALPRRMKVADHQGKRILRLLAQRRGLPPAVWNGPKRGFGVPIRAWLFDSEATPRLRAAFLGADGPADPLLASAPLADLWRRAETNPALSASVFRVLAYRWWRTGIGAGGVR